MFLQPRIQTVGTVSEFVGSHKDLKKELKKVNRKLNNKGIKAAITTFAGATAVQLSGFNSQAFAHQASGPVNAAVPVNAATDAIKGQIISAFDPVVEVLKALSYPIASLMLTAGCLMILIGMKDRGYTTIINAAIGYIIIQLSPLLLKLLVGIGNSVAAVAPIVLL